VCLYIITACYLCGIGIGERYRSIAGDLRRGKHNHQRIIGGKLQLERKCGQRYKQLGYS